MTREKSCLTRCATSLKYSRCARFVSIPWTYLAYLGFPGCGQSPSTTHRSLGAVLFSIRMRVHSTDIMPTLQDICVGNMLRAWHPQELEYHEQLELDKIYLIDFGGARRLELGPGHQPAIDLPASQIGKPNPSMERFDPYAWDVYCVGMSFKMMAEVSFLRCPRSYADLSACATVCVYVP